MCSQSESIDNNNLSIITAYLERFQTIKLPGSIAVPNELENSRYQKIEAAGREYLTKIRFQPSKRDIENGIFSNVGHIVLARKTHVFQFVKFYDEDGYLGDELSDAIYQVLSEPTWHSMELLRISIDALVSKKIYDSQLGYFSNTEKKLLGFVIQKNPYEQSHFAWRRFREFDGLGTTGLGALEALRLIGVSGVHVPTVMFDLCHLLIKKESDGSNKQKIHFDDLRYSARRIPGEVLPHKVFDLGAEKPYLMHEGRKTELNKIFGFQLFLQCKPERMLLINDSQSSSKFAIDFNVRTLSIGSSNSWSSLGKDQFFAITDENILALESPSSIRILNTKFQTDQNKFIAACKDEEYKLSETQTELEKNSTGIANFAFYQGYRAEGELKKSPPGIYLSFGLEENTFNQLIDAVKKGEVECIQMRAILKMDSAFTTTSWHEGFASDVLFKDELHAEGEIDDFSIEYRIK